MSTYFRSLLTPRLSHNCVSVLRGSSGTGLVHFLFLGPGLCTRAVLLLLLLLLRGSRLCVGAAGCRLMPCYDNKPVPMITTGHHTMEDVTFTRRRVRIDAANGLPHTAMVELTRLNVIHDYNCHMDGVDVADQLRGYYSCWLKSMKWWHAILFWMLDTAMCNAYIMHKEGLKGQAAPTKSHLQFQTALAHKLLDADAGSKHASSSGLKRKRSASAATERPQSRLLGSHLVQTIQGSRASVTPQRDCVLCKEQGKRSNYECSVQRWPSSRLLHRMASALTFLNVL